MVSDFSQHCMEIAKRFLQTAVIVDDEARIDGAPPANHSLVTPDRHTLDGNTEKTEGIDLPGRHSLDARVLVDSFARHGLICGVIAPRPDDTTVNNKVVRIAKQADIVVLDWQLNVDNGRKTMSMLKEILKDNAHEQLRLIAIYTGEQDISGIGKTIAQELEKSKWKFQSDAHDVVLCYQHCRIVIYAKSDISLALGLEDRTVPEEQVPEKLIRDFASMTEGLLPSIALTSLTAIRENVHKVLDKFHAELDPAFLAHRACLPAPEDSQQHMVDQLASELHAVMDDAAAKESPAGMEAIIEWLVAEAGPNEKFIFEENKQVSLDEAVDLQTEGWKKKKPRVLKSGKKEYFDKLASVFAKNGDPENKLDHKLAWMFSFRTVFDDPRLILHLGTVLREQNETSDANFFLCMRPRCDSVRLNVKEKNSFLLLPLIKPEKKIIQLVLRTCKNTFQRFSVGTKASQWQLVKFNPENDGAPVIAEQEDDTGLFFFTDIDGKRFDWLGELKPEFAQRIAHRFASGLSRIAVNNSEWLRRLENLND